MDNEILIISKYLIEKSQYFSKKKQVMSICTDRIILQGLSSNLHSDIDLDKADSIDYADFSEIRVSEKNSNDFTIVADKKYDFSCAFRNRLICELTHEVSLFQQSCDCDLFYCKLHYDTTDLSSTTALSADMLVYESMIKIKVPLAEWYNEMAMQSKQHKLGPKFALTQAIIQKYREVIFAKHEKSSKRSQRRSTELLNNTDHYHKSTPLKLSKHKPELSRSDLGLHNSIKTIESIEGSKHDIESLSVEANADFIDDYEETKCEEVIPTIIPQRSAGIIAQDSGYSEASSNRGFYRRRYTQFEDDFYINYIYMTDIAKILFNDEVFIIIKENKEVVKVCKDEDKQCADFGKLAEI